MFVIDRFHPDDLLPVMELASRTLDERYPPEFFLTMADAGGNLFRVARHAVSNEVLGFIVVAKEPGLRANLLAFAIEPDHQGQGIGRALLRSVQRTLSMEDVRELELEVRPDNGRARRFYERYGFEVRGRESAVYRDGSDALLMSKPIL